MVIARKGIIRSLREDILNVEIVPKYRNMIIFTTGKIKVKQNTNPSMILKFRGEMESMTGK